MAVTAIWQRFGRDIAAHPRQTLAAFLGDAETISKLDHLGCGFPTHEDFAADPAYNPNPRGLDMDADWEAPNRLVMCLMTWGRSPILHIVNACSRLQCVHQTTGDAAHIKLRDAAASALQSYLEHPSDRNRRRLETACEACRETYQHYEEIPDSSVAQHTWTQLGAPWLAAEAAVNDWDCRAFDGEAPGESQSTWINRNAVWPRRAVETAAGWTSFPLVLDTITSAAMTWATRP